MSHATSPSGPQQEADAKQIADWQEWMQVALIRPDSVRQGEVDKRFTPGANLEAADCLAIYQRGYILRLTKCLAEQFPALCHALGEQLFDRFARRYLRVYPSDSYTLYELGRRFSTFLEEDRPDREQPPDEREGWVDFMVDLARYERLHFKLFDAPGHEGNSWPDRTVPDHDLTLQPCFESDVHRYPVAWYYHAIKENPDVDFPPNQVSHVALLRKDYQVTTFPISAVHYQFLQQLQACGDVADALARVSELTATPLETVTSSWRSNVRDSWIDAGFFVKRDCGEEN